MWMQLSFQSVENLKPVPAWVANPLLAINPFRKTWHGMHIEMITAANSAPEKLVFSGGPLSRSLELPFRAPNADGTYTMAATFENAIELTHPGIGAEYCQANLAGCAENDCKGDVDLFVRRFELRDQSGTRVTSLEQASEMRFSFQATPIHNLYWPDACDHQFRIHYVADDNTVPVEQMQPHKTGFQPPAMAVRFESLPPTVQVEELNPTEQPTNEANAEHKERGNAAACFPRCVEGQICKDAQCVVDPAFVCNPTCAWWQTCDQGNCIPNAELEGACNSSHNITAKNIAITHNQCVLDNEVACDAGQSEQFRCVWDWSFERLVAQKCMVYDNQPLAWRTLSSVAMDQVQCANCNAYRDYHHCPY